MLLEPFTNTTSMGDHEALARYGNKMTKPTRVLLAEADTISAQLLSFSLKRENFEVVHVRSGNDALHMARERHFDLVLAEVQLPNVDGLELCRQLRTGWNTRNLPIVLITTLGSTEERI